VLDYLFFHLCPEPFPVYTRKNAQVVTSLQTSCYKSVHKLSSHCLFPVVGTSWEQAVKVIPQFCIAHFYCAHLITYNFIHYTYHLKKYIIL
jgi:hypothetical protein